MKHTSRGSGPSVFNGFEGRVRHTLASHSGRFWATSWAWILLGFRCFACIVHSMFSGPWSSSQPRPKLPFTCRPLHGCRGCGKSVCIGFERWMKHTSRGSGPSVFNGFEGRVRHTLASHSGSFWATSWAWILLGFRCFACIVHSMFSGPLSSSQPRPKLPFTCRPLHGCRGCGKSVCIGFERWMKHTSRGSGPSVFNGFEGRVRHTLASHPGPFWATSWAWILLGFRCFACIALPRVR